MDRRNRVAKGRFLCEAAFVFLEWNPPMSDRWYSATSSCCKCSPTYLYSLLYSLITTSLITSTLSRDSEQYLRYLISFILSS